MPAPAPLLPDDDARHQAMLDGLHHAALRRPPSWAPAVLLPTPGAFCSCCGGRVWWRQRIEPCGWCCRTCYGAGRAADELVIVAT